MRFLFIALGNPGDQYARTRHNAGWLVLDALLEQWSDPSIPLSWRVEKRLSVESTRLPHAGHDIFAFKPQLFMNRSGEAARATVEWYLERDLEPPNQELRQVVVFHDDLDLELGRYKLQFGSGPQQHHGLNSIRQHLQTEQFWVARIGIDNRQGDRSMPGEAYVLQRFAGDELRRLTDVMVALAEELFYQVLQ